MKKAKKLLVFGVALAMALSLFAGVALMPTMQVNAATTGEATVTYGGVLFHGGKQTLIDDNDVEYTVDKAASVELSETEITLPNSVTHVRTPKGKVVAVVGNKYAFKELGFYTLIMGKFEGLRIECVTDGLELKVDAASVPTLVKAGEKFTLPTASMVTSRGKVVENSGYIVTMDVIMPDSSDAVAITNNEVTTTTTEGAYFIRYTAKKGANVMMKDFTVQTQKDFADTEKPTLTVTGMPSNANVRTKVTLPVATAKDNYDTNVGIKVTVTGKDELGNNIDINEATVNIDGYTLTYGTDKVAFDNQKVVSFYPEKTGKYVVTYSASDDNNNVDERAYSITVKDTKNPVVVVKDENLIPATWGLTTNNKVSGTSVVLPTMNIPKGIAYDNVKYDNGQFEVTAGVQIKAPNGDYIYDPLAKTPINLENCVTVGANGSLNVNFSLANKGVGTYTVIYTATDANKNPGTKEYKVLLVSDYSITKAPKIDTAGFPDSLEVGTILKGLSTLGVTISSPADGASNNQAAKVSGEGTKYMFTKSGVSTATELILGSNGMMLTEAGTLSVEISAKDPLGNEEKKTKTVQVLDFMAGSGNVNFTTPTSVNLGAADLQLNDVIAQGFHFFAPDAAGGDKYEKAKATIQASANAGFEAYVMYTNTAVTAEADAPIEYVQSNIKFVEGLSSNGTVKTISILDAEVPTLNGAGEYTLVIRSFDQGYTGNIWSYTVSVTGSGSDVDPWTKSVSAKLTATGVGTSNVYGAQTLSRSVSDLKDSFYLQRTVTGKRFSIMNTYFVPMTANDRYTVETQAAVATPTSGEFVTTGIAGNAPIMEYPNTNAAGGVTFKITENYKQYYKLGTNNKVTVTVPAVTPISPNGDVISFVRTYTAPDGNKAPELKEGETTFEASMNGIYTITYTANTKTGTAATFEIKITVGDVVKPNLTVETKPSASMAKGSKFKFSKLTATDSVTTTVSDLKFKRVLLSPDGSELLTDENSTAGTEEATLSQIGTYTVSYTVTDKAGNPNTVKFSIVISDTVARGSVSQTVTIVLIVVVCLLVVGLLIYFFVFRKIDLDKKKKKLGEKKSSDAGMKAESKATATAKSEEEVAQEPIDVEATEVEADDESDKKD